MPKDKEIHKAAYKGDIAAVEDILDNGEDVNAAGAQNRTALHRAVGKVPPRFYSVSHGTPLYYFP